MKSESYADHENEKTLEIFNQEFHNKLVELQNFLTTAPIALPHRNVIRGVMTSILHLTNELSSEANRVQEFRAKINETLNSLPGTPE